MLLISTMNNCWLQVGLTVKFYKPVSGSFTGIHFICSRLSECFFDSDPNLSERNLTAMAWHIVPVTVVSVLFVVVGVAFRTGWLY